MRPEFYSLLGHDGPPRQYWTENLITGDELKRCPVRDLLEARVADPPLANEFDRYVEVYFPAYKDGHLLVAGGIADQPARYNTMIQLMRATAEKLEVRHLELTKEQPA